MFAFQQQSFDNRNVMLRKTCGDPDTPHVLEGTL
nr:MAG TPA_asm: hypothetical protein [Caudoviricetes sp.]